MYYVYVLKSLRLKDKIYIGYTSDLKKRLEEHMTDKNYTTARILSVELAYKSKMDAQNREQQLKQYGNALGHLKKD